MMAILRPSSSLPIAFLPVIGGDGQNSGAVVGPVDGDDGAANAGSKRFRRPG